jgi:2-oxo-4-hydroxy-4-carboxy--5-ureidoimidazoline (OHCU) decarboxylase
VKQFKRTVTKIQTISFTVRAGILRVHPDLAGRIAEEGRLTSESLKEQSQAGLGDMTQEEKMLMRSLNKRCPLHTLL